LLDVFSITQDSRYRAMALSAADFIVDDLFWSEGESVASFSYPLSGVRTRVHNANFLGAALLCRAFACSEQDKYLVPALKVTRYSAGRQRSDGSWDYGESSTQGWVDHFHTGFNLCALRDVARASGTGEFDRAIERGFDFYRQNFFTEDAAPKYFHNQAYPYDIHSAAQAMLTLIDFKDFNAENVSLANAVCQWTLNNLHDPEGYFHFQKHRYYTNKIPYMRWSQAWMLLALSVMLLEELP
jgi:hypothetical protein